MYQVKISKRIEQELARELREYEDYSEFALAFLLGKGKRNVAIKIVSLNDDIDDRGGCSEMQHIEQDILKKESEKMLAKGITPCGIVRLGWFSENGDCEYDEDECGDCDYDGDCNHVKGDHIYNPFNFSDALVDLERLDKKMYILSYARYGMEAHRSESKEFVKYLVKVVK